jgi:uncharacterized protein
VGSDDEPEATVLTRQECFELLSRVSVGRVGVSIDALPAILPVHFAVSDQSVLFRTVPGTKLDEATVGAVVAFQADAWEPSAGTHWSVLLQGIAFEMADEEAAAQSSSASIRSWGSVNPGHRLVRIDATNATGRRFRIAGEGPLLQLPDPPPL